MLIQQPFSPLFLPHLFLSNYSHLFQRIIIVHFIHSIFILNLVTESHSPISKDDFISFQIRNIFETFSNILYHKLDHPSLINRMQTMMMRMMMEMEIMKVPYWLQLMNGNTCILIYEPKRNQHNQQIHPNCNQWNICSRMR